MSTSTDQKPMKSYIPGFLRYCQEERHLSSRTQENYSHFLDRFVQWLDKNNLGKLKPFQLTREHLKSYKTFLTHQSLKQSTQNYYLIGIRALLRFFDIRDIRSLASRKVKLIRTKKENVPFFDSSINEDQIEKVLNLPDVNTPSGLRDRVILATIIFGGLKINQLIALDRKDVGFNQYQQTILKIGKSPGRSHKVLLPKKEQKWLDKYLSSRDDNYQALFINYRGPKISSRRLTPQSVQRRVKQYTTKAGLFSQANSSCTPEDLRIIYPRLLLEEQKKLKIKNVFTHQVFRVKDHFSMNNINSLKREKESYNSCNWQEVEYYIDKEIKWLRNHLAMSSDVFKSVSTSENKLRKLVGGQNCLLRRLAILIISGFIQATEIKSEKGNLWYSQSDHLDFSSTHGGEWHQKMMKIVQYYFSSKGDKVVIEPPLSQGRADLGIALASDTPLYIEIGSVSLYKLWYNFFALQKVDFLLVPCSRYCLQFSKTRLKHE